MEWAVRYATSKGTLTDVALSKWHCTTDRRQTLCGRLISFNDANEEEEDLDLIDCVRCKKTMILDGIE